MKHVSYHSNPGNGCALACYTMAAQYLMPEKDFSFDQLSKIANYRQGYVVWGFELWKWLMDQGIYIIDFDTIDYEAWAEKSVKGLEESVPPQDFEFYQKNTYDLAAESKKIKQMISHPNFTYIQRRPTWKDVVEHHNQPGICDVTLNSKALNHQTGFSGHRVMILDINDHEVVFHDPNKSGSGKNRRESLIFFKKIFEDMKEPELAHYSLKN